MKPLSQDQVETLGRIQAEMTAHGRPWKVAVFGDEEFGVSIDLGLMLPYEGFDIMDDELDRWAGMVPGYDVDDIGHGMEPVDGLIWRTFHLVARNSEET